MPKRRTSVRFAEQNNQTFLFCTEAYTKDLWYKREDYKEWKQSSRTDARAWRQKGYGILLEDCFEQQASRNVQKYITAFAQLNDEDYLRGVERYLNKKHDMERTSAKQRAIQGVLVHQRRLQKRGDYAADELAEELAFLLQEYSRPARRFASRIGKADEIVAQQGEKPEAAKQLIVELCMKVTPRLARWSTSASPNDAPKAPRLPRQPMRVSTTETKQHADSMGNGSFRSPFEELERATQACQISSATYS